MRKWPDTDRCLARAPPREARLKEDSKMPDDGTLDCNDQHWLRHERFVYAGREVTYDDLRADAEGQAAGLDPDQWIGGEFDFDWRIHSEGLAPQNYSGSIRHSDENGWLPPAPWTVVAGRASCQILVGGRRDSGRRAVWRRAGRRYDS